MLMTFKIGVCAIIPFVTWRSYHTLVILDSPWEYLSKDIVQTLIITAPVIGKNFSSGSGSVFWNYKNLFPCYMWHRNFLLFVIINFNNDPFLNKVTIAIRIKLSATETKIAQNFNSIFTHFSNISKIHFTKIIRKKIKINARFKSKKKKEIHLIKITYWVRSKKKSKIKFSSKIIFFFMIFSEFLSEKNAIFVHVSQWEHFIQKGG